MATLLIKVVPGARRNHVVGRYGDAIKVHVSAPPADGKANDAVVALIARALGVASRQVTILRGHGSPRKLIEIAGMNQEIAEQRLAGTGQ